MAGEAWVWDSYYVDSVSCRCDGQRSSGPFGEAVQGDTEFAAPVRSFVFEPLSRVGMLDGLQCSWSDG
jgi:hypothetical protein